MEKKIRYNSLDCLKGIACIAVVLIHFSFTGGSIPENVGIMVKASCRFAVPIFFSISGFFLSKDREITPTSVLNKLHHIMKLTFFAGCFYFLFAQAWYRLFEGSMWNGAIFTAELINTDKLLKFLLTHDPLLYSHLWFLLALICCYLFVLIFVSEKTYNMVYILAPILLCAYILMQEFQLLPSSVSLSGMTTRIYLYNSFLFRALPFFLIGMIMRDRLTLLQKYSINTIGLCVVTGIGFFLEIAERFTFGDCQFYLGSYIVAYSLMIWTIQHPEPKVKILQHIGRDLSMYIYILHIAVSKILDLVAKNAHWWGQNWYYISRPIIIIAGTLLVAEVLFQFMNFIKHTRNPNKSINVIYL